MWHLARSSHEKQFFNEKKLRSVRVESLPAGAAQSIMVPTQNC